MERRRGREAIGVISGVSHHNFSDEVRADMDLPGQVIVNDLTLREGRQLEGVVFGVDELIRITRQLEDVGVPMVQLGMVTPTDNDFLKTLSKRGLKMKAEIFCVGHQAPPFTVKFMNEQIDRVIDLGIGVPDLPFALADDFLRLWGTARGKADKSIEYLKDEEISLGVEAVEHAKKQGVALNVNLQDFMRCDLDYLQKFCQQLEKAGVGVITLDDITGPALPAVYKYCARKAKQAAPNTKMGIHVHNDFALGLAGVLGSLEGGAEVLDCGVNGYGARGGHADLAHLAIILEFLYGYDTGVQLEKLTETARLVADIMRQPLPVWTPVVGENAFSHLRDSHWLNKKLPWALAALSPEVVGNSSRVLLSEQTGPFGLKIKAADSGINIPDEKIGGVLAALREQMRWAKRPPTEIEFLDIVQKALAG